MFLHKGKEYYPLDITEIISKNKSVIYHRELRNRPYVYVALDNTESKGEE